MFYPTTDMPAIWIMVRPMDGPAFLIPNILAVKADVVAHLEFLDWRRDVDVMVYKECLAREETNDKSLVS